MNEVSTRYSIVEDFFEQPHELRLQSTDNKQGSSGNTLENPEGLLAFWGNSIQETHKFYTELTDLGVAREQARNVLPLSTYTEIYWKMDLRNLFHFLKLRLDSHAQLEIREFAQAIASIVKDWVPLCWEAFEDYELYSVTFSRYEHEMIKSIIAHLSGHDNQVVKTLVEEMTYEDMSKISGRELREFLAKL